MSVFNAPSYAKTLHDAVCFAFGLPLESGEFEVKLYSWGQLLTVYADGKQGSFDVYFEDGAYKFIEA